MRRPIRLLAAALPALLVVALAAGVPAAATPAVTPAAQPVAATSGSAERLCAPATADHVTCFAERSTAVQPHAAGGLPSGYGPADFRSAYAIPATGGTGVTVAVVAAFDAPTVEADLATYRSTYGLPALTSGQFRKVDQDGDAGPLPGFDSGWAGEIALDTQMVSASCPACQILLVEADSTSLDDIAAAAETAVRLGATYVSNSYGVPESAFDDGGQSVLPQFAGSYSAPGVTFVASTGDNGVGGGVAFPAVAPGVLAVGGTRLTRSSSTTRGWTESAWIGAGSGCSGVFDRPAEQAGVTTDCAGRAVADVSAVADPNTGVAVYTSAGGWRIFGGTSAAAPLVTGMAALAGHPGETADAVYDNATSFHDVTTGGNGSCGVAVLCTAGAGWDGPTGVGTPAGISGFVSGPTGCGGTPATTAGATGSTTAGRYVALTPTRVLDTRTDSSTLGSGATRVVDLAANLPGGTASAVVVNVTVTNPTAVGFVTVSPAGADRPLASNLNTVPGLTRANQVTVALGATGGQGAASGIALYNSAGSADLVVDLLGYYTAAGDTTAALTYHPAATPTRAVDTRTGGGALGAAGRSGRVCVTTSLTAGGAAVTGIGAVAVTLTAVYPSGLGYLKAWNGDASAEPLVSSLNFTAGQTVPNAAVVPVSCLDAACSQVTFAVANRVSPSTQVLVDVVGVYASSAAGGLVLRPQVPQRIADSRQSSGLAPLGPDSSAAVVVPGAVAAGASAVAVNVTAVAPSLPTYLTVYGGSAPGTSNLNPVAGEVVAAAVVSGLDTGGTLRVYNKQGRCDVVVDVAGLFVPAT